MHSSPCNLLLVGDGTYLEVSSGAVWKAFLGCLPVNHLLDRGMLDYPHLNFTHHAYGSLWALKVRPVNKRKKSLCSHRTCLPVLAEGTRANCAYVSSSDLPVIQFFRLTKLLGIKWFVNYFKFQKDGKMATHRRVLICWFTPQTPKMAKPGNWPLSPGFQYGIRNPNTWVNSPDSRVYIRAKWFQKPETDIKPRFPMWHMGGTNSVLPRAKRPAWCRYFYDFHFWGFWQKLFINLPGTTGSVLCSTGRF